MNELVPARGILRRPRSTDAPHPRYVVWELTLACDQRCTHCGSRAADARGDELSTDEALELVRQLAAMGAREVVLIGGEAYLHPGFLDVLRALRDAGIRPALTTGGRGITADNAQAMRDAGLEIASVSIDGLPETHDLLRATPGGFDAAIAALRHLRETGVRVGCNTVVSRLNFGELEALYDRIVEAGIEGWQVQIVAPLGRAADRPEMLLQPWQLLELIPRLVALKARGRKDGVLLTPANNVGYYSVDEKALRSAFDGGNATFRGCQAGRFVLGVESDGAIKGCPSLQTAHYVGGHIRNAPLKEIWDTPELTFTRTRTVDDLWGFCRTCAFAETCMAGCTFTAQAVLGRPGNNPYCHFRAKTLADQGLRERIVPVERAPGLPFDQGRFELVTEAFDAPEPPPPSRRSLRVWRPVLPSSA